MTVEALFMNAVGFSLPYGIWREPRRYASLNHSHDATIDQGILTIEEMIRKQAYRSALQKTKDWLASLGSDALLEAEVRLKYAYNLFIEYKRNNLAPTVSLAQDFTFARQQVMAHREKQKPPPKLSVAPAAASPKTKGPGGIKAAGAALVKAVLIFMPSPPGSGGKGSHFYGRQYFFSECSGERPKP